MQKIGLGSLWSNGLMMALSSSSRATLVNPESAHFLFAMYWRDVLWNTGQGPTEKIPAVYYPLQKDLYQLLYRVAELKEHGSKYAWVDKSREDLSPTTTPQLYKEVLAEEEAQSTISVDVPISSDLMEGLTEEERESLGEKPIETLDI